MLNSNLKFAFRSIRKHKIPYVINFLGFITGIVGAVVLAALLIHDWKFDSYHPNAERIHKLSIKLNLPSGQRHFASSSVLSAEHMSTSIPEIEAIVRMRVAPATLTIGEKVFTNQPIHYVDSGYSKAFKVDLLLGEIPRNRDEILISSTQRQRLFGEENPIGKSVNFESQFVQRDFMVSGVYESYPTNTSFRPSILASFSQIENSMNRNYGAIVPYLTTFILTSQKVSQEQLQAKADAHFETILPENLGNVLDHRVEPYASMHFNAGQEFDFPIKHEVQTLIILGALAIFIIISVFANFFNIQLALALQRNKELTIKRILGGTKSNLFTQTLADSVLLLLPSFTISMLSSWYILSQLETYTGLTLRVGNFDESSFLIIGIVGFLSFAILATVISFILSSRIMTINTEKKTATWSLRRIFIGFQFCLAGFFILNAIVVSKQLKFLNNQELGFNKEQLINVSLNGFNNLEQANVIKQNFLNISGVQSISASQVSVFGGQGKSNFSIRRDTSNITHLINVNYVDESFLPTTGIDLLAGQNMNDLGNEALINVQAAELLGYSDFNDAIGRQIEHNGRDTTMTYTISGIVTDYLYATSHQIVEPIVLIENPTSGYFNLTIKAETADTDNLVADLEMNWESLYPGFQLNYSFVESSIENSYQEDFQKGQFYQWATYLLVFIAALGVFGLTYYYADQKRKEIGIRKAIGARMSNILTQIIKPILWISLISLVLALPVAYYVANDWLSNYQYGVGIGTYQILLTISIVMALATVALLYPGIKASNIDPVDALKEQ